ncbi:MAG: hypothetical protein HZA60_01070 [Deltaproteobacteria bacterium]|nr:hypothetical protein [Deltaproteobacteria bacterium]
MPLEYRYAGPDGDRIGNLPAGVGAAIGSEYCVHLLPGPAELMEAVAAARERHIPLLVLTPYFRDVELRRAVSLFRRIPRDADLDVAVNDWGALLALHDLFPWLRLSLGRLLSGQKRCPRIGISSRLTADGRSWHGEGIFSSGRARSYLREMFGVSGYHVDSLPWGETLAECPAEDDGNSAPLHFIHGPSAIVTLSDACPWICGKSSASVPVCSRPCRDGAVVLKEPSMGEGLVQRGKARFVRTRDPRKLAPSPPSCRMVFYDDLP